jgi:hypothetical protein
VSRKKFVVISRRFQDQGLGIQQLRIFRSFDGEEELIVNALDRNAYQRAGHLAMSGLNGLAGRFPSEEPAHAPMSVVATIGLQRADIGQFFQQRWKGAQRAFFEIICGVKDHVFSWCGA